MQPITSKRLAGPGFIILNVIRAMNIIGFLAVIAASMIMVIKTFTASKVRYTLTLMVDNEADNHFCSSSSSTQQRIS